MNKILELREKRTKAWEATKTFLDTHKGDKGYLSPADDAAYERMEQEVTALGREIARLERQEAFDAELNRPVGTPITEKPEEAKKKARTGRASDTYNSAFWNHIRNRSTAEIRNALSEGTDSEGGFLVPDTFEKSLVQALDDELVIRTLAHTFKTASGAHKIPVVFARGAAAWTDEGKAIHETNETFGQKPIGAHKLTALIKISEELLNDSAYDLEIYFRQEFARQISNAEEDAFIAGTGADRPFGIFNATEGGEVGVTTAAASTITADELIDLYHSLRAP